MFSQRLFQCVEFCPTFLLQCWDVIPICSATNKQTNTEEAGKNKQTLGWNLGFLLPGMILVNVSKEQHILQNVLKQCVSYIQHLVTFTNRLNSCRVTQKADLTAPSSDRILLIPLVCRDQSLIDFRILLWAFESAGFVTLCFLTPSDKAGVFFTYIHKKKTTTSSPVQLLFSTCKWNITSVSERRREGQW